MILILYFGLLPLNAAWICSESPSVTDSPLDKNDLDSFLNIGLEEIDLLDLLSNLTEKVSKDLNPMATNLTEIKNVVDAWVQELRAEIQKMNSANEKIAKINRFLFEEQNFQVDRSSLFESTRENMVIVFRLMECPLKFLKYFIGATIR